VSCSRRPATQEPEWEVVLGEVCDYDDALALYSLFASGDTLFANDLPVDALDTGIAILSQRCFAGFLAEHLASLDGAAWDYMSFYTHDFDAIPERVDALVARCREAGVELHHRPEPPSHWRVIASLLASDADLAAFAILARDYTANSWPIDLEDELPMPRQVDTVATAAQLADLIARGRRAGVVLRRS
jgi:hypothetical protein